MGYIVLSQKKDFKSQYNDELFKLYHFPSRYLSSIEIGDIFVYNQGKQGAGNDKIRYYFGTGTIGEIYTLDNGVTYYAKLCNCKIFYNNVSIKLHNGEYVEQLDCVSSRKRPNFESAIRKLTNMAYKIIVNSSGGLIAFSDDSDEVTLKNELKHSTDDFFLNAKNNALLDIIKFATKLAEKLGVEVNKENE